MNDIDLTPLTHNLLDTPHLGHFYKYSTTSIFYHPPKLAILGEFPTPLQLERGESTPHCSSNDKY